MGKFFKTDDSWSGLILRVGLGGVMLPHGAQKLLGWFEGPGFNATMAMFTAQMHIPAVIAALVIIGESVGALGLIVGLFSRVAAFGILCNMLGAIVVVHWHNGFFMNWTGKQGGEGFEYHLLAITISLAILKGGAGRWSLDRALGKRFA